MTARIVLLAVLALLGGSRAAMAFDCGKARTAVETAICGDPKLRAADDAMAAAYEALRGAGANSADSLRLSQRRWLAAREACWPADLAGCVGVMTQRRTALLTAVPETGPNDGDKLAPWFVQKEGKKGDWDLAFDLFRFGDPKTAGEELFNRQVAALTVPVLLENSTAGTQTQKVPAGTIYDYRVNLWPTYASRQLISALAEGYQDIGGAHPSTWSRAINVVLEDGRLLSYGDVFPREAIGIFAKLCADQLVAARRVRTGDATINLEDLTDVSIIAHIKDFENWSFRLDKATILFNEGIIGARDEGAYSCDLDMARLREHALQGALLPR